jgi:hypothetical protein
MVWIGYRQFDQENSIRPVAIARYDEGYVETVMASRLAPSLFMRRNQTPSTRARSNSSRNWLTLWLMEGWRSAVVLEIGFLRLDWSRHHVHDSRKPGARSFPVRQGTRRLML